MARYSFSEYQRGLTGIQRIELIGSFYEKWFTMQMLTQRGYVQSYGRDVPFWTNFYDLFPNELQQIFQGMIQNEPEATAPRVDCGSGTFPQCNDPRIVYLNFFRGDCSDPDDLSTCAPPTEEQYADLPVVDPGGVVTLQFLGAVFALSDFPTFFDTSFQNQLFVCTAGEAPCPEPSAGMVEGDDFVEYTSDFYGKTFRAFDVEETGGLVGQRGIGFAMVEEAKNNACLLDALVTYRGDDQPGMVDPDEAFLSAEQAQCVADNDYTLPTNLTFLDDEVERLLNRQRQIESFFFQLMQLLRQFGISSYLRF